jgi:TPR repeat protein
VKIPIRIALSLILIASLAAWWRWQSQDPDVRDSASVQAVGTAQGDRAEESLRRSSAALPATGPGNETGALPARRGESGAMDPADVQAQLALADSYLAGSGVEIDAAKAAWWYRQAAEQGDPGAQLRLGELYEHGIGVAQDLEEAFTWYGLAADHGDAAAQANLGDLYESGSGIRSNKAAVHYYRLAAAQGYRDAQADLGRMYELGKGVAPDPAQAWLWYARAAAQGDATAAQGRDRMRRQLSPAQIEALEGSLPPAG